MSKAISRRDFLKVSGAVGAAGLLAACGEPASDPSEAPASEAPASEAPASEAPSSEPIELTGIVNTDGSTSMNDVMLALIEGFKSVQPGVTVNYNGSGSGSGISGVLAGSCDLGLSSRALTDDEKAEGAVENVIAKDGVAVVVNPANRADSQDLHRRDHQLERGRR